MRERRFLSEIRTFCGKPTNFESPGEQLGLFCDQTKNTTHHMTNISEIDKALRDAGVGAAIRIQGYTNSNGDRHNIEVEILPSSAHKEMLEQDLSILREADASKLCADSGDLANQDVVTAREQLIASRESSLAKCNSEEKTLTRSGPDYVHVGVATAKLPDQPNALYILRLKLISDEVPTPKPAKGAIPKAKQKIAEILDLPTRRYIHAVKLEAGKFEDLQVFPVSSGPVVE